MWTTPAASLTDDEQPKLSAHQKALKINLDPIRYGTFAEIGAGQEVARWFFKVARPRVRSRSRSQLMTWLSAMRSTGAVSVMSPANACRACSTTSTL